jgi:uncharacterized protein YnzC (UPF0291/DUF896 family)
MLEKEKIDRINSLAKKAKSEGLTAEETEEQCILRGEYLKNFREHFKSRLDNIKFIEDIEPENKS